MHRRPIHPFSHCKAIPEKGVPSFTIERELLQGAEAAEGNPRPNWTQAFMVKSVATSKVQVAGIAPASLIPQVVLQYDTCVEQGCQWLHNVCTEEALSELVAAWHGLASEVREKIMELVRTSQP